jgi:hypothetical protein
MSQVVQWCCSYHEDGVDETAKQVMRNGKSYGRLLSTSDNELEIGENRGKVWWWDSNLSSVWWCRRQRTIIAARAQLGLPPNMIE